MATTTADVENTMDESEDKILCVMGDESSMSVSFSGDPLTGNDTLEVKFTDGTTISTDIIEDTMTVYV